MEKKILDNSTHPANLSDWMGFSQVKTIKSDLS